MKRLLLLGLTAAAAAGLSGQEFRLGSPVADFSVNDVKGAPVRFSTIKGDYTVVLFIATQCPVSNAYNERMKALYASYAVKGVKFVAINSNATEPAAEVEEHAANNKFPFAVYKDPNNVVADRFGAQFTPEAFLLGRGDVIVYHGAIDDSQNPASIKSQHLRSALDDVLAGRPAGRTETRAFGCTIKRVRKTQ